jgi:hypothetical protein
MKSALLIGIDQYPDPRNNLNSCVADTLAFRNLLMGSYGFAAGDIRMLHNSSATLANARTGLDDLVRNGKVDDQLVFFESSHGYRYPQGDTLVEVLCLYDAFLTDTEFAQRTQSLPPGVLTVVLDACHSGGMDKVFFPPDGPAIARTKVWQPPVEKAIEKAQQVQQVTRFKFFGRAIAAEAADVAKAFSVGNAVIQSFTAPNAQLQAAGALAGPGFLPRMQNYWTRKTFKSGDVELNGALFAACQADQTAQAGSPATNNLSAFTYALIDQLDTGISLRSLCDRTATRLQALNMAQTPVVDTPSGQPQLATETFITMQPIGVRTPAPLEQTQQQTPTASDGVRDELWNQVFGSLALPPNPQIPQPQAGLESILRQIFGNQPAGG